MDDDYTHHNNYSDLDMSFTSLTTFASSARSSFSRTSSLALTFNDSDDQSGGDLSQPQPPQHARPHRRHDPHWSSVRSGDGRLHLRQLKLIRQLGAGDVGRVFLCRVRDAPRSDPNSHFALKVVDRHALSPKKLCHVDTEARILSTLDHPFLPTLYAQITASHYRCLLIDYCSGGDLNSLLRRQPLGRLPLPAVRFYAAELLLALEYLHSKGIVYRDLKPENILLRENGHIMLSDFDLCFTSDVTARIDRCHRAGPTRRTSSRNKHYDGDDETEMLFVAEPTNAFSKSCVGTHEYLAPELVSGNGYGSGVDWWAFGVLIYELIYGTTPFKGVNKEATVRNIASADKGVRFPAVVGSGDWAAPAEERGAADARDLVEALLVKDPRKRMGAARGATDIKRHPFFEGVKWPLIRSYRPPEIVRGVVTTTRKRMSRAHVVGHVSRKRNLWRALTYLLTKAKGSSSSSK